MKIPLKVRTSHVSHKISLKIFWRGLHILVKLFSIILPCITGYDIVHYRNIWDGLFISQNKKRFGYKTLFEVNGLPSIELKYHYPGIDLDLLSKIKGTGNCDSAT